MDFSIYEIVNYFRLLFPNEIAKFTKLTQIRDRVAALPSIAAYEASDRAVGEYCPIRYFKCFKEEKMKASRECGGGSSGKMEAENQ